MNVLQTLFASSLVATALGIALAQPSTAFPPKVGETWRLDVDGLPSATLRFTAPSSANPGAVDGTSEMAGFNGRSRSVANQGQQIILWQGKEGVYYCVFAPNPSIQGASVKGLGAALERPGAQPVDLNKGCSATNISSGSSVASASNTASSQPATTAKPDVPLPVPAAAPAPQRLEPGQVWHVNFGPASDAYAYTLTKPASSVPGSLGNASGWFEARVNILQRATVFSFSANAASSVVGYVRSNAGALQFYVVADNNRTLGCEFASTQLRGNRYTGGALRPADAQGLTCNAQWGGTSGALPAEAAATLENMRRALGAVSTWNALKTVGIRTQSNLGGVERQTVTILDFVGKRLYREFYQGSGSQQVVTAKEWQLPQTAARPGGTYRLEAGTGAGVQRSSGDTVELLEALNTDFWALRQGAIGWDSATLEPQADGSAVLTAGRGGQYTRYLVRDGKYAGRLIQNPLSAISGILSIVPGGFADAGGILAPSGKYTVSAVVGQGLDPSYVDTVLRVLVNPALPADLFEPK
jgi:hypothetical protein